MDIDNKIVLDLYQRMLKIRLTEETIAKKYFELEINGGLIVIDGELSKLRKISCNVQKGGVKIMT